jgi:post-segregation antitoxin (ccd killing protein)
MFVSLSMDTTADETGIRIYYDDDYAIPLFGSRELAEVLAEAFANQYDEKQVAVIKTADWELSDAMVPAVRVVCSMAAADGEEITADVRERWQEENAELIAETVIKQYQEMEENK